MKYENPLESRYASKEMLYIFSSQYKFSSWRKLWVALAKGEKELGLDITDEQIVEMETNINNIDFELAAKYEKEFRHDVMAHVHTYGDICKSARPIIHLGATSAYVGDNTDILQMRDAIDLVEKKLVNLLANLTKFADEYKGLSTLGFTHFQPAQLTTVGKRATLWMMDLLLDYNMIQYVKETLVLRGVKGTTGTQASFLHLFDNDHDKVKKLDKFVANYFGFNNSIPVSGQTYTRKLDSTVLMLLSSIAQSMHKMTNDLRLLQHLKEVEEPFEKNQIGSSAMAYKRNPMRSERIAALSRFVITSSLNPQLTQATQWFERTLDDSANKRLAIPESFLAIDSILDIGINITSSLVVYEKVINKHVMNELPFMATENIMMEAVKKGKDRQELHEKIRIHSMEAARMVKEMGLENDLLDRIKQDDSFGLSINEIDSLVNPILFIGRSENQVVEFINDYIKPILDSKSDIIGVKVDLRV
jgi:adenylosuccinate lyase